MLCLSHDMQQSPLQGMLFLDSANIATILYTTSGTMIASAQIILHKMPHSFLSSLCWQNKLLDGGFAYAFFFLELH